MAGKACRDIEKNGGILSSISLWEIGITIKNKKLEIGMSIDDYARRVKKL